MVAGRHHVPADSFPIAIAVDATNVVYVALSRNGGVFKSVDAGRTLAPRVAGLPSACYDESLFAIAPSRPSTIYLSRCDLFRSVDSGATWKSIAAPPAFVTALAVHPRDPDRILAGTDTVWFSDDAGESWTAAACEPGNVVLSMSFDPATPSKVLATVYGVYEVARSEDGGETWVRSRQGFFGYGASAVLFDPGESSTVYATTHGIGGLPPELPYSGPFPTGVNRSTDGGSTWASLPGAPSAADLLAIDPTGDWVYAGRYSAPGVSVYQAHPDRSTIVRPSPRARPPQVIPRPPARTTPER